MDRHRNNWNQISGGWPALLAGLFSIPLAAMAVFSPGKLYFTIPAFLCLFFFGIRIVYASAKMISTCQKSWDDEKAGLISEHHQQLEKLKEENKVLADKIKEKEKQELVKTNIGLSMILLKNRLTEAKAIDPSAFETDADARKQEWQKTNNLFTYVEKELAENFSVSAYTLFRNAAPKSFEAATEDSFSGSEGLLEWQRHVSHIETKLNALEKISGKLISSVT